MPSQLVACMCAGATYITTKHTAKKQFYKTVTRNQHLQDEISSSDTVFSIFLTDAVEVTDEDVNSPLVSYLLTKVQRLEAKMMAKPIIRNTRDVEKHSVDTNTSADDKKTKDCPQQVVTYIRWGNTTCPYGANSYYLQRNCCGRSL